MRSSIPIALILFTSLTAVAQTPPNYQLDRDWLIDSAPFTARIETDPNNSKVVLSNGLVRRVIRLKPNAATVRIDNLMNGQAVLRAVHPEATVTIDGTTYPIGGLRGQPDRAYLTRPWLDSLEAIPNAMRLTGIKTGTIEPRFAWKQTRHHGPGTEWPPKGVYLRMDYALPAEAIIAQRAATLPSSEGRNELLSDDFKTLTPDWQVHTSQADARSSFSNEGKVGEIYTPANTSVYAERALPKTTRLVEVSIDTGTDKSASWGPGLGLVWPKRTVKFFLRPGAGSDDGPRFGLWDGRREHLIAPDNIKLDLARPWTLRMRLEPGMIYCEARPTDGPWRRVAKLAVDPKSGTPTAARVGKLGKAGGDKDYRGDKGPLSRLHVEHFAVYGRLDPALLKARPADDQRTKIRVSVHYQLYDKLPVFSKWVTVHNQSNRSISVDHFVAEELSVVEFDSPVETREGLPPTHPTQLHAETDMAFGGGTHQNANRHAIHWRTEPEYRTQVNYLRQSPCRLVVEPTYGPAQDVPPGKTFESFRLFELVYDGTDSERRGLTLKRMYRTIAPWITENPLMMHMRIARPDAVRQAIDQCAEVGFELLILSFGSGFNAENDDPKYLEQWKSIADYAHSKGIQIGCYSLLSSRRVNAKDMIVFPPGQTPTHGQCPALTSDWGQAYFAKLYNLFEKTGFDAFEHDGSYPGDVDVTPRPPLQKGAHDSRWAQWRMISDYYKWMRGRGAYLNVPDFFYLVGSNKCGMGYRETNWSLPRAQQLIHARQNIYDGTWSKTPSMGWMFVPLTQYHGGGPAATIEPLDQHLPHYESMINTMLGMGVQACYRGPRLFDTDRTRDMVKARVAWYKKYRDILESDMIHGRRADGYELDWILHANPDLPHKGMLVVYNPTDQPVTKAIQVSLYYTGLNGTAMIRDGESAARKYPLSPCGAAKIRVTVPARGFRWYVVDDG